MRCFSFIFARGGSQGVKRKNIRMFAGKPLIAHSIEIAKASPSIDRVIVSTEDEEIAEISKQYGAEVPFMRPKNLAENNTPEWLAWQHAIKEILKQSKFDYFISLPTTSPLRSVEDIETCINLAKDQTCDVVVTVSDAHRSPYFNMVTQSEDGDVCLVINPNKAITCRQKVPQVYDMTTVAYVSTPAFILNHSGIFDGKVKAVKIPQERAIDIDTELDFKIAEFLFQQGKSNE